MSIHTQTDRTCRQGHHYQKSSNCPVCPKCQSEYSKKNKAGNFDTLSTPSQRALLNAEITTLEQLSKNTEKEILALHGMGPASLPPLRAALKAKGLSFKKE